MKNQRNIQVNQNTSLTEQELKDSQELVSMLMDIIDNHFLESKPMQIVLELRRVLSLYDSEWNKERDYPPKPWRHHPSAYLWYNP